MSSKNVLLRSKADRLTVARLDSMRLAEGAGPLLVTADLVVNLIVRALPVVFTIAAAVVVGRIPAAVWGGDHPSAWSVLLIAFVFAAMVSRALIRETSLLLGRPDRVRCGGRVKEFSDHDMLIGNWPYALLKMGYTQNCVRCRPRHVTKALICDASPELLLLFSAKSLPRMRNLASWVTVRGASKMRN